MDQEQRAREAWEAFCRWRRENGMAPPLHIDQGGGSYQEVRNVVGPRRQLPPLPDYLTDESTPMFLRRQAF